MSDTRFPDEILEGITQTVLCTSVQWSCGHYTTAHGNALPSYCPVCTGQVDALLLEAPDA